MFLLYLLYGLFGAYAAALHTIFLLRDIVHRPTRIVLNATESTECIKQQQQQHKHKHHTSSKHKRRNWA